MEMVGLVYRPSNCSELGFWLMWKLATQEYNKDMIGISQMMNSQNIAGLWCGYERI